MLAATTEAFKKYFRRRQLAYRHVFNHENQFTHIVLEDLAKFCRAHASTFHKDPNVSKVLEGRREVFLRIAENLNLSTEQIYDLHIAKNKQGDE